MALYFETNMPEKLLNEFKKIIDEGRVMTWLCDKDGDFTYTSDQWKNQAWFRPKIEPDRLALYIIRPKDTIITSAVYAFYHGRFIESMLIYCDKQFKNSIATALPSGDDNVSQG